MPLTGGETRGLARWAAVTASGVTIEPTANVTATAESLLPRSVFRNGCIVSAVKDFMVVGPIGARNDYLTITFRPYFKVTTGCFDGSLSEFAGDVSQKPDMSYGLGGQPTPNLTKAEYEALIVFLRVLQETRCAHDSGSSEAGLSDADLGELYPEAVD